MNIQKICDGIIDIDIFIVRIKDQSKYHYEEVILMRIGYACLTVGVADTGMKSCIQKNASDEKLYEIIQHNLDSLDNIISYNIKNNILLFRISSDIIPFGSSEVNRLEWWNLFKDRLSDIGGRIIKSGMRVSMHPGQYTVLNSNDEGVVSRAVEDLNYHTRFLDSLGLDSKHKIILHIGGIYGDKESAVERFISNYKNLSDSVKARFVIENDDRSYNIHDVITIGRKLEIPVIFDNLHNEANPYIEETPCIKETHCIEATSYNNLNQNIEVDLQHEINQKNENYWIHECESTWKEKDGPVKIHYSQQNSDKKKGSHSSSISIRQFMDFYRRLDLDIDIMLEVKDKNLSAVKCINCTTNHKKIRNLELEWGFYKYKILENSPEVYNQIRSLLNNKIDYRPEEFYSLIEQALSLEGKVSIGTAVNAAQHIWGYFKDVATDKERYDFMRALETYTSGGASIKKIKSILWKYAVKYNRSYLIDSYYFVL